MSKLLDRLAKKGNEKPLSESDFFGKKMSLPTDIYTLNGALSTYLKSGGLSSGMTGVGGHSRHFKSNLMLACAKAFLRERGPEAVIIFFDNEFGITPEYLEQQGINPDKVLHVPIQSVEELRHKMISYLDEIERGDDVMFMLDSLGNAPSKKELKDARDDNDSADMTRAKVIKSFFRIIATPVAMKAIPFVFVNHIYECGTEDVFVQTPGGFTSLKDLEVGDVVQTTNGWENITFKTEHEDATVYDIEFEDGRVYSFTPDHKLRVNGVWTAIVDIQDGDEVDEENLKYAVQ